MSVNTKRVAGRRKLRFNNFTEVLAEVDRLAAVPCHTLGNWPLGKICRHLALAMDMSIDGSNLHVPLPMRMLARLFRGQVLAQGMTPGFQLPPPAAALLVPGETETAEGIAALRQGVARLADEPVRKPHAAFGAMTREQWDQLHLRHAELHLGFVVPDEA